MNSPYMSQSNEQIIVFGAIPRILSTPGFPKNSGTFDTTLSVTLTDLEWNTVVNALKTFAGAPSASTAGDGALTSDVVNPAKKTKKAQKAKILAKPAKPKGKKR
jgi:hypothetical protein